MRTIEQKVVKLWEYGCATAQIATRFGIPKDRVRKILNAAGIDLRSSPRHGIAGVGLGASGSRTPTGIRE